MCQSTNSQTAKQNKQEDKSCRYLDGQVLRGCVSTFGHIKTTWRGKYLRRLCSAGRRRQPDIVVCCCGLALSGGRRAYVYLYTYFRQQISYLAVSFVSQPICKYRYPRHRRSAVGHSWRHSPELRGGTTFFLSVGPQNTAFDVHTDNHKERGRLQQTTPRRTTHAPDTHAKNKDSQKRRTTTASWRMWLLLLPRCLSPLSFPRLAHSGSRDPRTPCLRRLASQGQSTLAWPRAWRAWDCWRDNRGVPILLPAFFLFSFAARPVDFALRLPSACQRVPA